jgi:hypothetical protein
MFKIFTIFTYFIRELIFDSKDEYDFKSSKFNTRKFTVFILVVGSITANVYIVYRSIKLASSNIELKKESIELKNQLNSLGLNKQNCSIALSLCEKINTSHPSNEGKPSIKVIKGKT